MDYIDWNVSARPGQPFFLYFPAVVIHGPIVLSPEFLGQSNVVLYGDFVMQADAALGSIVAKLKEHG